MKTLIHIPHSYDTLNKVWTMHFMQMEQIGKCVTVFEPSLPLSVNRNKAAQRAIDEGFDYVFFIDHDNIMPPNVMNHLLSFNVPVMGLLYFERKPPHLPLVYTFPEDFHAISTVLDYPKANLVRCDVIGMGCCLIKTDVFKQMTPPYFSYNFDGKSWGTEDAAFFHQLKVLGIPVHIDTKNTIGHIGEYIYGEQDWLKYSDEVITKVLEMKEAGIERPFFDKDNKNDPYVDGRPNNEDDPATHGI